MHPFPNHRSSVVNVVYLFLLFLVLSLERENRFLFFYFLEAEVWGGDKKKRELRIFWTKGARKFWDMVRIYDRNGSVSCKVFGLGYFSQKYGLYCRYTIQ